MEWHHFLLLSNLTLVHSEMSTFVLCLCVSRMGLPVDSPDRNDDAHKYEQQGEEDEGQTQVSTHPLLPITKKRKKGKKRYITVGSSPFVLLQLFPLCGCIEH